MIYNFTFVSHSVLLMPHAACSPADDDLPASSSGSLAPSDVDSILTASTPRDAEDTEVGSREGTHQVEAPEAPQGSLPDFALDSISEPAVVPESGRRPLHTKGKTDTGGFRPTGGAGQLVGGAQRRFHRGRTPHYYECGDSEGSAR